MSAAQDKKRKQGRPLGKEQGSKKYGLVRIDKGLHTQLKKAALHHDMTMTSFVESIVRLYIPSHNTREQDDK